MLEGCYNRIIDVTWNIIFATRRDLALQPRLEFVVSAELDGFGDSEVAGQVQPVNLVVGKQEGERVLKEVDPLEQEQDVQLLQHFLPRPRVVAQLLPLRLAVEHLADVEDKLSQVVE